MTEVGIRLHEMTAMGFGYDSLLQFAKAAATQGVISLDWDPEDEDYVLGVPKG